MNLDCRMGVDTQCFFLMCVFPLSVCTHDDSCNLPLLQERQSIMLMCARALSAGTLAL